MISVTIWDFYIVILSIIFEIKSLIWDYAMVLSQMYVCMYWFNVLHDNHTVRCYVHMWTVFKFEIFFIYRDRDHHLKTFKSVIPAYKLVEWLVSQVMWRWTHAHRNTLYYKNFFFLLSIHLQTFILGFCTQFISYFCSNVP